ncbi:MAG TPA: NAD(P)/FAD-dependent oxidoreductase [Methylibium sp.]|nr:NAD(P)/FAD-dependent oxidoreductase [Methylibium sp.]
MKVYNVAILGTGFGGIGMALRLREEGETDFVILEKAASVGGTWRDNTYPGAACDVQSHLYWFSFTERPEWSRSYCAQPEILRNIELLAEQSGLLPQIRFNTEVIDAAWDDQALLWRIRTANNETLQARVFVTAWGQLNRPSFAGIEGRADFQGTLFHSARWQHDTPLEGKRVACIGVGPSAVQFIPELAQMSGHLTVFQRSPNYVVPRLDRPYTDDEQRIFHAVPATRDASRQAFYADHESWFEAMRQNTPKAAEFTFMARAQLDSQVDDPALREKLWPDYPIGCKRIVIADDFYPVFNRPNVRLETQGITRIEAKGIRTADGTLHEFDVIVFGTGFETHSFLGVSDIKGQGGQSLRESWKDAAEAYLGINVAGFPNLYMLYGPNTNLGHNSIILMIECQIAYTLKALRAAKSAGARAIAVKAAVMSEFNRKLQKDLEGSSWAGSCSSWYKTADGRITNNWSGSVEDYKARTAGFDIAEYELTRQPEPATV